MGQWTSPQSVYSAFNEAFYTKKATRKSPLMNDTFLIYIHWLWTTSSNSTTHSLIFSFSVWFIHGCKAGLSSLITWRVTCVSRNNSVPRATMVLCTVSWSAWFFNNYYTAWDSVPVIIKYSLPYLDSKIRGFDLRISVFSWSWWIEENDRVANNALD